MGCKKGMRSFIFFYRSEINRYYPMLQFACCAHDFSVHFFIYIFLVILKQVIIFFCCRGKQKEGSRVQWGVLQGRFISYDYEGVLNKNVYLRMRGVKERSWAPYSYQGILWSITITVAARDGTTVMLRLISYEKDLNE